MRRSWSRLRAAGAVILGKTNLSSGRTSAHAPFSGWSAPRRVQPESLPARLRSVRLQLGVRVAPAANLCAASVGTETDGSIVCPSGNNLVVGIKPTMGLLSAGRDHPDRAQPGHRGADDAHR